MTPEQKLENQIELQRLLLRWDEAKKAIPAAALIIKAEQDIRKQVIAFAFPEPEEGTNSLDLASGWKLKATCPVTRTVDEAAFALLKQALADNGVIADSLMRYKAELEVKKYKALTEASRAIVDQSLTIKPGSYSLELVAPKAK